MTKDHLIVWDNAAYNVGIESIDQQHRILVDYINELAWAIDNKKEKSVLTSLLIKLCNYAKFHCKDEEAYFFTLNKDDCLLHELQHKHFIEELDRVMTVNEVEGVSEELLYSITDWLLQHIQIEDKKYLQQHLNKC